MTVGWGDDFIAPPFTECNRNNIYTLGYSFMSLILSTALSHYVGVFPVFRFIPNRSLEKVSCHFLMTAIRKTVFYMLDP